VSDDAVGLTNVEDEAPVQAPAAEPPAPEPAEEPAAAEVEAVEVGGQKYVPLAAVIAERKEKQALKERAGRADQLEQTVNEMRPYVEFLRQNQGLMQRQPAAPAPAQPDADPAVEQLARTLDLYTPEGKPDLTRAGAIRQMMSESARQAAADAVRPVRAQSDQERSAYNYRMAMTSAPEGVDVDKGALTTFWQALPPDLTADPNVAMLVTLLAAGASSLKGKPAKVVPPANPPLQTEAAGGNQPARRALSGIERSVAKERGLTEEAYHKLASGFTPGRTNVLEE
jgi:hypothetical protein